MSVYQLAVASAHLAATNAQLSPVSALSAPALSLSPPSLSARNLPATARTPTLSPAQTPFVLPSAETRSVPPKHTPAQIALDALAPGERPNVAPGGPVGNALTALVKYIPTEVLTLYIATVASRDALATAVPLATPMVIYWFFVLFTPAMFLLLFAHTLLKSGQKVPGWHKWPWWKVFASTTAFGVWALAVPSNPYVHGAAAGAVSGLAALFVSTLLDLAAPVFEKS